MVSEVERPSDNKLVVQGMSAEDLGFPRSEIEFLVGMAQDVYKPTDFDEEVQRYLNEMSHDEAKEA